MENQSIAQRVKEQTSAIFASFCKGLEKIDPNTVYASGATIGALLVVGGAGVDLANMVEHYQAGGWEAVKASRAAMPNTALEFLAAAVQNEHATAAHQAMGVGGLTWAATAIAAATEKLGLGVISLTDALNPKPVSQTEDFRESMQRVRENLDKLNPPGPEAGNQETSFKSRGMR